MFCTKCGEPAVPDANFCAKCGGNLLPSAPLQAQSKTMPVTESFSAPSQVRPWARLWARIFDVSTFTLGTLTTIFILAPQLFAQLSGWLNGWPLLLIPIFIWVFVESLLLSTFQTTPGKWLFRTKIALASGSKISYSQALTRSLKVWWRGFGTGFPIAAIITMIITHRRLTRNGITSWDKDDGFSVEHEEIGLPRVLAAIGYFFAFFWVMNAVFPPTCESILAKNRPIPWKYSAANPEAVKCRE